jgi:predicted dehydrogenase
MIAGELLRWGLLGSGWIADSFATDLTLGHSGRVVAVGSRSRESADRFADKFGIPNRHSSYEALVEDPQVDVVYVATPHPMHHGNALLALQAGKPVLVEKPFTMNAAEARELVETARSKRLFLMEAMWTRFLPHIAEIRGLLAANALGDIVSVSADHGQWFAEDPGFRLFAPELGGGALLDLGIYPVSFASMILGPPDRIMALIDPTFTVWTAKPRCSSGTPAEHRRSSPARCSRGARPVRRSSAPRLASRSTALSMRPPPSRSFRGRASAPDSKSRTRDAVCATRPTRSRDA